MKHGWYDTGRKDSLGRPIRNKHKNDHAHHTTIGGSLQDVKSDSAPEYNHNTYNISIPTSQQTEKVVSILSEAGYQPYLVGGKIRDHLLGKDNKDVDIEVYNVSSIDNLVTTFSRAGGKLNIAGQAFGVIKYTLGKEEFDISLPRKDSLKDNDNTHRSIIAEVDPDLTEYEASTRRDFTMNALMYDPLEENIIDFHGGVEDIHDGVLRVVDHDTFVEDPLRVLRGVQFAARFDMEPDDDFIELSQTMTWNGLAQERIAGEIHKMLLKSRNLHRGVEVLMDTGWDKAIPGITQPDNNPIDQNTVNTINSLPDSSFSMGAITSMMDYHYGEGKRTLKNSFMLSSKEKLVFNALDFDNAHDVIYASETRRFIHNRGLSQDLFDDMSHSLGIEPARKVWQGDPPPYSVTGQTLINKGLTPGPEFSRIIQQCQNIENSGGKLNNTMIDEICNNELKKGK